MAQETEANYDSSKLIDINFGKYAIILRFEGAYYHAAYASGVYWAAKVWSLSS